MSIIRGACNLAAGGRKKRDPGTKLYNKLSILFNMFKLRPGKSLEIQRLSMNSCSLLLL